jgi:hypothetical protein
MNIKELKEEIKQLKKEVQRLDDENASLWFLLDEFEKSNIKNPKYQKRFIEVFERLRKEQMMTHKKVEEA